MFKTRILFEKLFKEKDKRKISIILGPRQVGKTTLLKELHRVIGKDYKALFLDLDIFSNYEKINSYENAISFLKINGFNKKEKFFLFIDEFQRYGDITIVLKNLYDNHPEIKIYATGSSSILIKSRIQDSLAGRKIITNLYPLNFREFLYFKERHDLIEKIDRLIKVETNNLNKLEVELYSLLDEFLVFGGYPEVALLEKKEDKIECLNSIFDLYLKKDILDYLKIEKLNSFKLIIDTLAILNGREIKYSEIAKTAKIDEKTVKNYIEILKETFLINVIIPFFKNKLKEITKTPKIYFFDNGVRNYFIKNFNEIHLRDDADFLFEGFCLEEIIKTTKIDLDSIKYWRTKNKQEVDFIIDKTQIIPVEVKFKESLTKRDISGLISFIKIYREKINFPIIITKNIQKTEKEMKFISPFLVGKILNF